MEMTLTKRIFWQTWWIVSAIVGLALVVAAFPLFYIIVCRILAEYSMEAVAALVAWNVWRNL